MNERVKNSLQAEVCNSIPDRKQIDVALRIALNEDYQSCNRQFPAAYIGDVKVRSKDIVKWVSSRGEYKRITDVTDGGEAFKTIEAKYRVKPGERTDSWFFIPTDNSPFDMEYLLEVRRDGNCLIPIAHIPVDEREFAKTYYIQSVSNTIDTLLANWHIDSLEALQQAIYDKHIPAKKRPNEKWVEIARNDINMATLRTAIKYYTFNNTDRKKASI